ncbi:MAG TPA: acyl-CoA dehydrogenase, partial [Microthrixaceae bacterium]|nr:acyl-CoA dehydrogenase [Microthrixaceae bacterium]
LADGGHQGSASNMAAMFMLMNAARMGTAMSGVAYAEIARQNAADYARQRLAGRAPERAHTPGQPADPIIAHPDVRRMLLFMRSHVEAMRALIVYNAAALDLSRALDGDEATAWGEIAELLTPVTKAWCTDVGMEVTSTAVQVFGGMGYIEESGVAQHFRDMRIAPIYEGTNGIQAMDLVGRKLGLRMGGVVNDLLDRMTATVAELDAAGESFASMATELRAGIDTLSDVTSWIMTSGLADPKEALAGATPYLRIFGIVTGGWLMARQALAARAELDAGSSDSAYLEAKIVTARFYAEQQLPQAAGWVASVKGGAAVLYDVDADQLASV